MDEVVGWELYDHMRQFLFSHAYMFDTLTETKGRSAGLEKSCVWNVLDMEGMDMWSIGQHVVRQLGEEVGHASCDFN